MERTLDVAALKARFQQESTINPLKIRFSNTYVSWRVHIFGPSRATAVPVKVIRAAAAVSQQATNPILAVIDTTLNFTKPKIHSRRFIALSPALHIRFRVCTKIERGYCRYSDPEWKNDQPVFQSESKTYRVNVGV